MVIHKSRFLTSNTSNKNQLLNEIINFKGWFFPKVFRDYARIVMDITDNEVNKYKTQIEEYKTDASNTNKNLKILSESLQKMVEEKRQLELKVEDLEKMVQALKEDNKTLQESNSAESLAELQRKYEILSDEHTKLKEFKNRYESYKSYVQELLQDLIKKVK